MKTIIQVLLKAFRLLLFPMVIGAVTTWAGDFRHIEDPSFKPSYRITPVQVRLLNRRQIGFYFSVTDNHGLDYRLKPSAIRMVELNDELVQLWHLDWQSLENPYQGIETLHGFKRFFNKDYSALQALDKDFFRFNRFANQIEIKRVEEKSVIAGNPSQELNRDIELVRLVGRKLLTSNDLGADSGLLLSQGSAPSKKLISLLANLKRPIGSTGKFVSVNSLPQQTNAIILKDNPNNSENRYATQFLQKQLALLKSALPSKDKDDKHLLALSTIDQAVFINATVIDRTTEQSAKKHYRYQPAALNISTDSFYPFERLDSSLAETMGYLTVFETETGNNLLVFNLNQQAFERPIIRLTAYIDAPDYKNHMLDIRLNQEHPEPESLQCKQLSSYSYCDQYLSLESGDRELIAYWKNPARESEWVKQDKSIRELYAKNAFQEVVSQIEKIFSDPATIVKAPLPLAGDWAFLTAESYRHLGDTQQAMTWYRKVTRDFPYSDNYTNAWIRMTEQHLDQVVNQ